MTNHRIFGGRRASVLLLLAAGILQSASAATITLAPVPGQRVDFPEGPQASVMFTIINNNADPMIMTFATAIFAPQPVSGDGFDVASGPTIAQNQCPSIAAFNVKTQTPGACNITVTFNTTDTFTTDPESPGDLVRWKLMVEVTARSLTHPSNSPQTADGSLIVGVYDTSLPEPSTFWLLGVGAALMIVGRTVQHKH